MRSRSESSPVPMAVRTSFSRALQSSPICMSGRKPSQGFLRRRLLQGPHHLSRGASDTSHSRTDDLRPRFFPKSRWFSAVAISVVSMVSPAHARSAFRPQSLPENECNGHAAAHNRLSEMRMHVCRDRRVITQPRAASLCAGFRCQTLRATAFFLRVSLQ